MSYRGYKGWRPNSRRNRRNSRPENRTEPQGSGWTLILGLGAFLLTVVVLLVLAVYNLR